MKFSLIEKQKSTIYKMLKKVFAENDVNQALKAQKR